MPSPSLSFSPDKRRRSRGTHVRGAAKGGKSATAAAKNGGGKEEEKGEGKRGRKWIEVCVALTFSSGVASSVAKKEKKEKRREGRGETLGKSQQRGDRGSPAKIKGNIHPQSSGQNRATKSAISKLASFFLFPPPSFI